MKGIRITGTMHEVWKMLQLMRYRNEGITLEEWMKREGDMYGAGKAKSEEEGA